MLILDSLLIGGLKFVLRRLAEVAEKELYDSSRLREELLAASLKLELGEITEEEYAAIEAEIVPLIRAVEERRRADGDEAPTGRYQVESVEADLTHDRKT